MSKRVGELARMAHIRLCEAEAAEMEASLAHALSLGDALSSACGEDEMCHARLPMVLLRADTPFQTRCAAHLIGQSSYERNGVLTVARTVEDE